MRFALLLLSTEEPLWTCGGANKLHMKGRYSVQTFFFQIELMKSPKSYSVTMYPEVDYKVWTNFQSYPSHACWDISLKTTNVNLMVVLEKKMSSLQTTSVQNLVPIHSGVVKIFYRIPEEFVLLVVLEEKSGDHHSQLDSFSGLHECLMNTACHCRLQLNTMIKVKIHGTYMFKGSKKNNSLTFKNNQEHLSGHIHFSK